MDPLDLARWQFGITTVYHFLMVPLTIGLGLVVAVMQTLWVRTGREQYLRMTKFWGKLFLINFIMGVATGIVQEFQFGMAWSEYSRFVGDVFGAPLALEALIAFFLESVFLGVWIFGWGQVPRRLHLAAIWCAVIGAHLSAYFIMAANAFMQHPVGYEVVDGRPVLNDIGAVLANPIVLTHFPHTIAGSWAVAGGFLLGISWYHLWKRRRDGIDTVDEHGRVVVGTTGSKARDRLDHRVWITSLRAGAAVAIVGFLGTAFTGHAQAQQMIEFQPTKMASAEAACHDGTAFSVLTLGDLGAGDRTTCTDVTTVIELPGLLSYLAYEDFTTPVPGLNSLLPDFEERYGAHLPDDPLYGERAGAPIDYQPLMEVTYWGFRLMITFGGLGALAGALTLWMTRRGTVPDSRGWTATAVASIGAPFAANVAGWVFTEMGRQPFVVYPNPAMGVDEVYMFTAAAVSPGVSAQEVLASLIVLVGIYAVLLVVEVVLMVRYVRGGVPAGMPELTADEHRDPDEDRHDRDDVLAFAY
ncbi:cytochrome BD ubiquinol oxidase subunit I [Micrococcus luteus]|uniref:cytochrome ubiquinol oxidase subunit I n=1 Tax=Micrococcus luteus TaxID=1270 RepID=UPI0005975333|nr:cytochrome ubiquinol oxidase subunit I [Micrococcus luteus]KIK84240.1 cytochrome BD ubiquinol oxidase subunit I [Micrococcus luteus]MCV7741903.1 cytochrome ubiquinol oxidase subunit I [Micrococcus luteus]